MKRTSAKVTLVRCSPEPVKLVASAARLCYASDTADLLEGDAASAAKLVRMLRKMGHLSPLEHASLTFLVEGVSRAMTHQLVRHRVASYSQRSQRYVGHHDFDYVVPPQLDGVMVNVDGREVDAVAFFEETMALVSERYRMLNKALGERGEGSNEDARYLLPNACETKIFVTMNVRELLHFFEERLCLRAQWEIRIVAQRMLALAREAAAPLFEGAGPKCIRAGKCPEGKLTCGRYAEIREQYA
jgi:thymidylate synthase (FAD)